jgi:hypothetical protein
MTVGRTAWYWRILVARSSTSYYRLNIYLDDPDLRIMVKIAAARQGVSTSAYCLQAIREKLVRERLAADEERTARRQSAARRLEALRSSLAPIGVSVSELVAEGRRFTE